MLYDLAINSNSSDDLHPTGFGPRRPQRPDQAPDHRPAGRDCDASPGELRRTGSSIDSNLLAHHLDVSSKKQGSSSARCPPVIDAAGTCACVDPPTATRPPSRPTSSARTRSSSARSNSARSPLAAAIWQSLRGGSPTVGRNRPRDPAYARRRDSRRPSTRARPGGFADPPPARPFTESRDHGVRPRARDAANRGRE